MKTDQPMINAVLSMAKRQYDPTASPEAQAIGGFCKDVLLPLMTTRANSNDYKLARRRLIERGRHSTEMQKK